MRWRLVRWQWVSSVSSGVYSPDRPAPPGSLFAARQDDFARMMEERAAQVITTVRQLADELGKTPAQLALAWVLSHPEITVAISGADTIEHLDDNIGGVGWTLDDSVPRKTRYCLRIIRRTAPRKFLGYLKLKGNSSKAT